MTSHTWGALAVYDFTHTDLKRYTIAPGLTTYSVDNMWLDRIPKNVKAVFVDVDRFNGKIDHHYYQRHNLTLYKFRHSYLGIRTPYSTLRFDRIIL